MNKSTSLPPDNKGERPAPTDSELLQSLDAGISPALPPMPAPVPQNGSSTRTSPSLDGLFLPESRLPPPTMSSLGMMSPLAATPASLKAAQGASKPVHPSMQFSLQQQQQMQNMGAMRSMMDQKQQLSMFDGQMMNHRMMLAPTAPLLQPPLVSDPRFLMGAGFLPGMQSSRPPGELLPTPSQLSFKDNERIMRGGVIEPFPEKLHRLLREAEAMGKSDVISWMANGRAFAIHKPDKFFHEIVPLYFRQTRLSSFKRQLNLYGFELIMSGPHRGAYHHKSFVKDRPELCRKMRRVPVKPHPSEHRRKDKTPPDLGEDKPEGTESNGNEATIQQEAVGTNDLGRGDAEEQDSSGEKEEEPLIVNDAQ